MSHEENLLKALRGELTRLRQQLNELKKGSLEISLDTITQYTDVFESQLSHTQNQFTDALNHYKDLLAEKDALLRAEQKVKEHLIFELGQLQTKLELLGEQKQHLEISLETVTEHADLFEAQLLETQNTLETKVAERTHELEQKNRQLEAEIRERLRAEAELRQSKEAADQAREVAEAANRAKTVFLAKMSHELRTPLNAIIGYSEMLVEDVIGKGCPELVEDIDAIKTAGEHLLELIKEVLDISKVEAERVELYPSRFNISELINRVITIITPSLGDNHLMVSCSSEIGMMYADAMRVQQILQNLLNNAIKFTHHGEIQVHVERQEEWIEFRVLDTGIGIPEEKLGAIFEAFNQADNSYTRRYDGMGLGLTICKQLCRFMGGEISVSSQIGRGSSFTVHLPIKREEE